MNLQSALGLSLAGVSLICSIGFLMHSPQVPKPQPDIATAPNSYIEQMPSSGEESYRIHILGADGVEKEIRIKYRDASDGVLMLGANGKTAHERLLFPDGEVRKEATYDADGVLLAGFEFRGDRTLLWQTALSADQASTATKVFWPGGRLFLENVVDRATKANQSTYYREDGSLWQESVSVAGECMLVKQYDEAGRLRVFKKRLEREDPEVADTEMFNDSGPWPVVKIVYYDAAGQTDFVQWIAYTARWYWDESMNVPNPNPLMIAGVEEYKVGIMIARWHLDSGQRVRLIDTVHPDGAIRRLHADRHGKIFREDFITKGGSSSRFDYTGALGKAWPVNPRLLARLTDDHLPLSEFNAQEALLKARLKEAE